MVEGKVKYNTIYHKTKHTLKAFDNLFLPLTVVWINLDSDPCHLIAVNEYFSHRELLFGPLSFAQKPLDLSDRIS